MKKIKHCCKRIKTDDIGSFPLPRGINRQDCHQAAILFHKATVKGLKSSEIEKNRFIRKNFIQPVIKAFKLKQKTGLDYPNYPQFRDMNAQFLDIISDSLTLSSEEAIIPEVEVLQAYAKRKFEEKGEKTVLQICITGAIELGIAKFGAGMISDGFVEQFALCVDDFVKTIIEKTGHCEIGLISFDEPRLGLVDLPRLTDDGIIQALDIMSKGCDNVCSMIHLHSFSKANLIAEVRNIDILAGEFASDPSNYSFIDRDLLHKTNKKLRAGIAVSSMDSLLNNYFKRERIDKQILQSPEDLKNILEPVEVIRMRINKVLNQFGDLVALMGPDCGLGGWIFPEVAAQLLTDTVDAVREVSHHSIS